MSLGILKSNFTKNIFTLASGTAVAQAVTLLISPILSRLFTPEDFGIFAFYMSIVAALALIATLRYELAVMIPDEDDQSVNVVWLAFITDAALCIFLMVVIVVLGMIIPADFSIDKILRIWLYFLPLMVFLLGTGNVFQNWFNRKKRYKGLAHAKIINSFSTNLIMLVLGLAGSGAWGLLIGNLSGIIVFNLLFIAKIYFLDRSKFGSFSKSGILHQAKRHKDFPIANMPQSFLDMLQMNGIIYLLQIFFTPVILGWYSFAMRVLQAPMWLIVSSIAQVFYKEASENYQAGKSISATVNKTIKMTAFTGLPALVALVAAGPWLFTFVFGKPWKAAGEYAQILAPWLYFDFIRYSVAQTVLIVNKMRPMLFFSVIGNIIVILSLIAGGLWFDNVKIGFAILSALMVLYDLTVIFWILRIIKKTDQ